MKKSPNILALHASARLEGSHSRELAEKVIVALHARHSAGPVQVRDLATNPLPHVSTEFTRAIFMPQPMQSDVHRAALELSNQLIGELLEADVVVIDTPMYNLTVPSCLKAWIDHIVRPGLTFSYGPDGFKGLLQGKHAILVVATGGHFSTGPRMAEDFLVPYLRQILGFVGISEVQVIRAENLAVDPERGLADAHAQVAAL